MNYFQITIPAGDPALQEILIAQLGEYGYEGFEEQGAALQAFIPEQDFNAADLEVLLAAHHLSYERTSIAEKNWNEEWEKNFDPVVVDSFCAIRASFHAPVKNVTHELIITPKMSFGTGHHATTYMMIQAMEQLDLNGRRVLDFGTGTGVLAILAEKLGAADVLGIDNDDWSIDNAQENLSGNQARKVAVKKMHHLPAGEQFDVILANINKHIILRDLEKMGQQLIGKGVILLSGLLIDDFEDIEREALRLKLPISRRLSKGNWICLTIIKEGN